MQAPKFLTSCEAKRRGYEGGCQGMLCLTADFKLRTTLSLVSHTSSARLNSRRAASEECYLLMNLLVLLGLRGQVFGPLLSHRHHRRSKEE